MVVLVGCQSETAPETETTKQQQSFIEASETLSQECKAKGGTTTIGGHGQMICLSQAKDAGKSCKSSRDCEGICLADGKVCSPEAPFYGCHDVYENGTVVTLCVD